MIRYRRPLSFNCAIQAATQAYTKILEDIIRQHPEQWLWMHKRWRSRPARRIDRLGHDQA